MRRRPHAFALALLWIALLGFGVVAGPSAGATESPPPAAPGAAGTETETGVPPLRNFPPRAYRGHEQVWSIVVASSGEILAGNNDAVLVFDGFTWRQVAVPGGSFIREMRQDASGTIWVGGVNELGRLQRGPDGEWRYESLRGLVPAALGNLGPIWKIHLLADGVWFQGNNAALRWNGRGFDAWPAQERTVALSYVWQGRLLMCRVDGWAVPSSRVGEWEAVGPQGLGQILPRAVVSHPDGRWLVLTGTDGLKVFDGAALTPFPTPLDAWLRKSRPYGVVTLRDGRRVFLSLAGGALVCAADFSQGQVIDEPAGLLTNTVIAATEDSFGALWLGTDRGLARVDLASPFTAFAQESGLSRDGVETVTRVGGVLRGGATQGTLVLEPAREALQRARFVRREGAADKFYSFLELADGTLAGAVTGLHWIVGDKVERLKSPSNVRDVIELRARPGVFVGTHLRGLAGWRRDGAEWHYDGAWSEPRDELRGLIEDESGALWTTTSSEGVLRVRLAADLNAPLAIERFGDAQGLPTQRTRVWLVNTRCGLRVATRAGLFRHDSASNRFVPDTDYGAAGVFDGSAAARLFAEDDRGGLWVLFDPSPTTAARLYRLSDGRAEAVPLPNAESLGKGRALHWERTERGETLWLAMESSVLRGDVTAWAARRDEGPRGATQLAALDLSTGAQRLDGGPLSIGAGERTLRFRFGTPWLAGEPDAVHETRLIGFGDGRRELGRATERTFTNLPPGHYTFEVRGRSADGRWSEPGRAQFTVEAPWWQSIGAVAGYLVLGSGAIFAYVRWRIRRLVRERTRLEDVIAQRTAELARKNAELERLHRLDQNEKLAARLAEEKAQLELLRYQLNPHFLYNSLNSIRALVYSNAEAAGEMVTRLSEFCRWTLTRGGDGLTTVAEEMEMLHAYLDIERTRWQEGLLTRVYVDPAARAVTVPQFLFLPLIENAIKYGGKTSPAVLEVAVTIKLESDMLVCEIANTGTWVGDKFGSAAPTPESTHIGLENLRRRLARYYGPQCRPHIITDEGWVCVRLRLPQKVRSGEVHARAAETAI